MTTTSRFFYGYIIVAICFLFFLFVLGLTTSFGIFFDPLIKDMGWSRAATSGAFSINIFAGGIFGIIGGWLNDRFGPRIVMPLFGLFSCLGYFMVSQMSAVWHFYLFFGLMVGLGSNIYVPAMSTIARWFVKRRSMMSGIAFSGAGFGLVVLPLLISWFLNIYDWRLSLVLMSIALLVVSILGITLVRMDPYKMGLIPYGADEESDENDPLLKEKDRSMTIKQAISTRVFWFFFIVFMCYGFTIFAFQVHIAVHASDSGISPTGAASVLMVLGIATLVGQLGLGGLGDRLGYKKMFIIGQLCIVLAVITILFARELLTFYIFAFLLGLAFGNCSTQMPSLVAWLFGLASHGTLLGFITFSFSIGAAIGPLTFGTIYDANGDYLHAFWIAGILSIIAVILSVFLKRPMAQKAEVDSRTSSRQGSRKAHKSTAN